MDKVREWGAPLPGNDKENWGNHHTRIWRKKKKEEEEREEEEKKRGEKKKEEVEMLLRNLQRKGKSMVIINLSKANYEWR